MKKIILGLALLNSITSFADSEFTYEKETFKGSYSKQGESFVCSVAYDRAKDKAWDNGFPNCSTRYRYSLSTSFFDSNKYTCKVYVECYSRVRIQNLKNGTVETIDE